MDDVEIFKYFTKAIGGLGSNDGYIRIYRDWKSSKLFQVEIRITICIIYLALPFKHMTTFT